jgi:hypothetical protein
VDVRGWITKATIDIIGLAGLDFQFDALPGGNTDFKDALGVLVGSFEINKWLIVRLLFPVFRMLVSKDRGDFRCWRRKPVIERSEEGKTVIMIDEVGYCLYTSSYWVGVGECEIQERHGGP